MILLNKEQIKYLHSKMIQETGGSNGIRDEGLLDSALSAPFQSFGGMELYPSMIGKAARLCYGLIKNHAQMNWCNLYTLAKRRIQCCYGEGRTAGKRRINGTDTAQF